jgi:hypothetical protein
LDFGEKRKEGAETRLCNIATSPYVAKRNLLSDFTETLF